MRYILTPCGTSLLTNAASGEGRKMVGGYANEKTFDGIPAENARYLKGLIQDVREKLMSAEHTQASGMSAEINALTRIYRGDFSSIGKDIHQLLCTDTWLGQETSSLVEGWLKQRGASNVSVKRQVDLQTASIDSFQLALSDLARWAGNEMPVYREKNYSIIFNLTGGFKSVQGFLQVLGMFYADEMVYVFETGGDLLRIPRLPVQMAVADSIREHLEQFRRMAAGCAVRNADALPETMLLRIGGETALSPWGEIAWRESRQAIYSEALHPSPSEKIRYGEHFPDSVKRHAAKRYADINRKIDDLMVFLEQGKNLQGLDFKPLTNNPVKGSTHEIDAWHDGGAMRIFGHYEGGVFVLDRLDEALHKG